MSSSKHEWYRLPGSRKDFRWSNSEQAYVYEDGRRLPSNLQFDAATVARAGRTPANPRTIPTSRPSASSAATLEVPITAISTRVNPQYTVNTTSTRGAVSQPPSGGQRQYVAQDPPSNTATRGAASQNPVSGSTASETRQHYAQDPRTHISTNWSIGLSKQQDPSSGRVIATKRLEGKGGNDDGDGARLPAAKGYQRSRNPSVDYVVGRVIQVLLVPPEGVSNMTQLSSPIASGAITGMRRFVIIAVNPAGRASFSALPIKTYNGMGVSAPGVIKAHHAVIYSRPPPRIIPEEQPRRLPHGPETGMRHQSIRVEPYDRGTALDSMSRLDFFDIHEFDNDYQYVHIFGKVADDSRVWLEYQHRAVWEEINRNIGGRSTVLTPTVVQPSSSTNPNLASSSQAHRVASSADTSTYSRTTTYAPSTSGRTDLTIRPPPTIRSGESSRGGSGQQTVQPMANTTTRLTPDEMRTAFHNIRLRAQAQGLTPPDALTHNQILTFASDPQARQQYIGLVNARWRQERQQRQQRPQTNQDDSDDDSESDDDDDNAGDSD